MVSKDVFEQTKDCLSCVTGGHVEFPTINRVLCDVMQLQYIPGEDQILADIVKSHIITGKSDYAEHLRRAIEGKEGKFEVEVGDAKGVRHWLRINYHPIPNQSGVHVSIVEDITKKKTLVAELEKLKVKG